MTYYKLCSIRITARKNRDSGSSATSSSHTTSWDPVADRSTVKVIFNFGRADELGIDALKRSANSITHFLPPYEATLQ